MPYIKKTDRKHLRDPARHLGQVAFCAGDLNYIITEMIHQFIQTKGGVRYTHINEVVGALECAKLELYRKIAAPYEDEKIKENGDVGLNDSEHRILNNVEQAAFNQFHDRGPGA